MRARPQGEAEEISDKALQSVLLRNNLERLRSIGSTRSVRRFLSAFMKNLTFDMSKN